MNTKLLAAVLALTVITACKKDKFETKPIIKVKEIKPSEVVPNQTLSILLEYTDKEGDLGKGQLLYIRNRLNIKPPQNNIVDTVRYTIPDFPATSKGEMSVDIPYNFLNEDPTDNDTMVFKLAVMDIKGNKSDTIQTSKIVARQN